MYHPQLVAVFHQPVGLDIIEPQENTRWSVMRYKGGSPPLMICTARCAAMIYQACGLDKKILVPKNEDFLCCHYKIDPYKAIVQKQSIIFSMRVHLSLGDDGRCTRPLSSGGATPCLQTKLCKKQVKTKIYYHPYT